jgi:hypothetical protein
VEDFAALLLDHVKTSEELMVVLNYNHNNPAWTSGDRQTLERLKLAIKYKQKKFVAHPNVQQLLGTIWYEGLPGFRRKNLFGQITQIVRLSAMFPIYCVVYMLAPRSKMAMFMRKPFVKFICHSSSYLFFLGEHRLLSLITCALIDARSTFRSRFPEGRDRGSRMVRYQMDAGGCRRMEEEGTGRGFGVCRVRRRPLCFK